VDNIKVGTIILIRGAQLDWNPGSERIITLRIKIKFRKMSVVQCYVPTDDAKIEEKEKFYSLLDRTVTNIHTSDIILMTGDFNARVGNNNEDVEHIMGKYGLPHHNENGDLLIQLCGKHGLATGGILFPHKDCHKTTWVALGTGGKIQNQIDHICNSRQRWK
jgi:hypothetical protein